LFQSYINDSRANFKTYIISALADWLTGAMGSTGIEIPKEFSVRAVIGMLLQVLGLSWAFLRSKLVALIGEQKVAWAEKTVDVVKKFVTGGVAALWDWIKDQASSIKDMFIQGTKDWLLTTLVTKFVEWVASLLIPGGAILRLIQGIYNLVMWFVNNIQKILRWVNAVLDSLGNVAMGAISAAIGFIVNGMKIIIPVILDFFARLLNISGIVDAVKKIIDKIAGPIHAAINKVIDWIVGWVKKMFGKGDVKDPKKPATETEAYPPEKQKKIDEGIADLRKEENKIEHNEKLTHKEANEIAKAIKGRHSVFSKFYVVDGGDRWNYKYAASEEKELISSDKKAEEGGIKTIEPAIEVLPQFKRKPSLKDTDFAEQLEEQQKAINKMKVRQWLSNRDAFIARIKELKEKGAKKVQGRDPEGDRKASGIRKRLLDEYRFKLLKETPSLGNNEIELEKKVKEYGDSNVIIHKLDQIAGGSGTDIDETKLGDARADFSLGAQWRGTRINDLDKKIREKVPEDDRENTKMNVILNFIDT
jgi:Novel toxin 15